MSELGLFIRQLLEHPGVSAAMLIDGTTGLEYGFGGDRSALPSAAESCDDAHRISDTLEAVSGRTGLENITVTTTLSHYVTQVIPRKRGDSLLLVVALARESTNLALAARQIDEHARKLLA
ncbi:hypothetical protein [Streptomyces cucumeris]|uniref:hypothetical protein n=1 Tax=Streptomyces cucumeris TaxID=2962890 RepID=UPI0020C92A19|nr:hypothetical protein [Streptomyces sp. NEAU-Y11]MCP9207239.1 hypothetical protein [Streptomyces sp. NEAU-Y11]